MRAILSLEQLRQILDRAIMGEKIAHMAIEYGADRSAIVQRLKRRFPEEYAKLSAAGLITCAPSEKALKARTAKLDEKWANDPSVLEYLHGNGIVAAPGSAPPVTLQQVADKYNISLSAMRERVQRALRHINKTKHAQKQNPQEKGNTRANQHANAKLEGAPAPALGQDAHISPKSTPLPATQFAAQPAAVACAGSNPPGVADYSDILTNVEILQDLQPGKRAP